MKRQVSLIAVAVIACLLAACGGGGSSGGGGDSGAAPTLQVTASSLVFRHLDVCKEVSQAEVEEITGVELSRAPEAFTLDTRDVGCKYPMGSKDGKPVYVFVSVGPSAQYTFNREYGQEKTSVTGLGDEAFYYVKNDTTQLWVLLNGRAGVVAGMTTFNEEHAKQLAQMMADLVPVE